MQLQLQLELLAVAADRHDASAADLHGHIVHGANPLPEGVLVGEVCTIACTREHAVM